MKLSTKGRYGVRALVELAAESGRGLVIKKLASDQDVSQKYLEKIFSSLKASGLVKSSRGANGGYVLARDPKDTTVLEVLNSLEGSLAPVDCVDDSKLCNKTKWCVTRDIWAKVKDSIEQTLSSITLYELAQKYKSKRRNKQEIYYI